MSLAEELLGKNGADALAKSAGLAKRVHRIDDDEEEVVIERDDKGHAKPRITPFLVGAGRDELLVTRPTESRNIRNARKSTEAGMPRGIYKRKKKSAGAGEAGTAVKLPVQAKRGRRANAPGGAAHFSVDESGCITIAAAGAHIALDLPDTKRLAAFLERTKAIRT